MTVTTLGVPAAARHERRRTVLLGAWTPTRENLVRAVLARWREDRYLHGYQMPDGRWHVDVRDGLGELLVDLTPDGVDDTAAASRVMAAATTWLVVEGAHPGRWEVCA